MSANETELIADAMAEYQSFVTKKLVRNVESATKQTADLFAA